MQASSDQYNYSLSTLLREQPLNLLSTIEVKQTAWILPSLQGYEGRIVGSRTQLYMVRSRISRASKTQQTGALPERHAIRLCVSSEEHSVRCLCMGPIAGMWIAVLHLIFPQRGSMSLTILFIVFMVLAIVGSFPSTRIPGSYAFLWLSVLVLFLMEHSVHL